eukprot:10458853-Karenia_brevis.AAC.1
MSMPSLQSHERLLVVHGWQQAGARTVFAKSGKFKFLKRSLADSRLRRRAADSRLALANAYT